MIIEFFSKSAIILNADRLGILVCSINIDDENFGLEKRKSIARIEYWEGSIPQNPEGRIVMCRNFSIFSTCFRDMSISSTRSHMGKGALSKISAKGGLNRDLNNRSTYLKISIVMPLIELMASDREIVDLKIPVNNHSLPTVFQIKKEI